jgi:hypothetical protein
MRKGRATAVRHRNGDMTAVCCVCGLKQRDKEWYWSEVPIGLDYVAYSCQSCACKQLEKKEDE